MNALQSGNRTTGGRPAQAKAVRLRVRSGGTARRAVWGERLAPANEIRGYKGKAAFGRAR
ncbi:MAG: hypothetical protein ABSD58_14840 [Verrucomicrobiia bacterium]